MRLSDWLESSGCTKTALAARVGITWAALHRIAIGTARPRLRTALAIERETLGAVTVQDLLPADAAERTGTDA